MHEPNESLSLIGGPLCDGGFEQQVDSGTMARRSVAKARAAAASCESVQVCKCARMHVCTYASMASMPSARAAASCEFGQLGVQA